MDAEAWLDNLGADEHAALLELLAISSAQADRGEFVPFDVEEILAEGRARRAQSVKAAAE